MTISSNTLFHFSTKMDYIVEILAKGFSPRLYPEFMGNIIPLNNRVDFRVMDIPMICFCDIPLRNINNHIKNYGSYGIGMKKEWGIKNKLNPIMYFIPNSHIHKNLLNLIKIDNDIKLNEIRILQQMKLYKGINKNHKNITFYDEKEWRYIPKLNIYQDEDIKILDRLNIVFNNDDKKRKYIREQINKILKNNELFKLHYDISDIKYIIIKNEKERSLMISEIINAKEKFREYTENDLHLLTSKILSCEQIKEDI